MNEKQHCPSGTHWVKTHQRTRTIKSKKITETVHGHCRINHNHFIQLAKRENLDLETLYFALTIYGEARNQPDHSKKIIAWVIRNRLDNNFGKSYQEIVIKPKQFSCWLISDPNFKSMQNPGENIIENKAWIASKAIAKKVMHASKSQNPIPGICFYFSGEPNVKKNKWQKNHFDIPNVSKFHFVKL